ncbi:proline-rich receptor-like protein kinase PERK12 [Lathyrus oleraceus]|uniref:proline-rich receptor-like protein kinase PERK12 n=1 Tax=Pisum sativum TaxID=3888 RepID=UPI0021CEB8D6|nr:proline-rich receptor-like protein kinase PERK12 [Pisum sativum]
MREPSERKSKKKTLKLGEPSTRTHVPLDSSASSKSHLPETPLSSILKQISSSLPQPSFTYTPSKPTISIPTPSEPTISIPTPSEPHNSETNPSSPPLQKFDLTTTTLPISEALLLNEPISPPSSTPSSPPYYDLSSDVDQTDIHDPSSPTLAQLQVTTTSEHTMSIPDTSEPTPSLSTPPLAPSLTIATSEPTTEPYENTPIPSDPINPSSELEPTFLTLEESFALFLECSVVKLSTLSE